MTVRLTEGQAIALDRVARRRGVSKGALVREALAWLLAGENGVFIAVGTTEIDDDIVLDPIDAGRR